MKPKSISNMDRVHRKFNFLPLYLADLNVLMGMASERSFVCVISDDENEYENLEDLTEHSGKHIRQISIKFSKIGNRLNSISVEAKRNGSVILTADSSDDFAALTLSIGEYLTRKTPWYTFLVHSNIWFLAVVFSIAAICTQPFSLVNPQLSRAISIAFLFMALMLMLSLVIPYFLGGVYLQRRHEVPGFWSKYEKIFLVVIGGVLTTLMRWIADHYLN